ncbi:RNA-binding S4 domain-containing protein [Mycoplasma sp. Ms02]|uniref:RNA-binding S4 domain-containing protein n=1 Tax=Mycoplasma sp. Ms02 TaxID=353851 RepID=UPI001C8954BE|nr:RNA-binding S4 domain-containing protein [Mycoplasma sp. Ms02]QZE12104.1 RNA-binding S4 domain-containing protein [Mycoplasma sp. Ms02]
MRVEITGEYIKLSQFLKKISETSTGGQSKSFLKVNKVTINGKVAEGRSSKIRPGDVIWINDQLYKVVSKDEN